MIAWCGLWYSSMDILKIGRTAGLEEFLLASSILAANITLQQDGITREPTRFGNRCISLFAFD